MPSLHEVSRRVADVESAGGFAIALHVAFDLGLRNDPFDDLARQVLGRREPAASAC